MNARIPIAAWGMLLGLALSADARRPAGPEGVAWYYDAETALRVAGKTARPIVVLKVRADIGLDVKT
ncbi:MAG TPA: hypothetical protein VJB14_00810 [Planctomycetota bacterium]|nr:hypothetical protein [Planctomycetota bacterium]